MIAIEFLTPTDKDVFIDERDKSTVGKHSIKFGKSFINIKVFKEDGGVNFTIEDSQFLSEYEKKKLFGYVLFKVITKYQ